MSWKACAHVKSIRSGLSVSEKLVLLVLAEYHHTDERMAWPSSERLAKDCLMRRRSVLRILHRLEEKGFIRRTHGGGRGKRTGYAIAGVDYENGDRGTTGLSDETETVQARNSDPRCLETVTGQAQNSDPPDRNSDPLAHAIRKEPSVRPTEPINEPSEPTDAEPAGHAPNSSCLLCDQRTGSTIVDEYPPTKRRWPSPKRANGRHKFIPPTVQEVADYCAEMGYTIDPQHWHDNYASKGWKVGWSDMVDWRAAVRNWQRNEPRRNANGNGNGNGHGGGYAQKPTIYEQAQRELARVDELLRAREAAENQPANSSDVRDNEQGDTGGTGLDHYVAGPGHIQ
jgi:hypothetical protein